MNAHKPLVAAAIATAMIATPAFGKAGEGPKFGFFDGNTFPYTSIIFIANTYLYLNTDTNTNRHIRINTIHN